MLIGKVICGLDMGACEFHFLEAKLRIPNNPFESRITARQSRIHVNNLTKINKLMQRTKQEYKKKEPKRSVL